MINLSPLARIARTNCFRPQKTLLQHRTECESIQHVLKTPKVQLWLYCVALVDALQRTRILRYRTVHSFRTALRLGKTMRPGYMTTARLPLRQCSPVPVSCENGDPLNWGLREHGWLLVQWHAQISSTYIHIVWVFANFLLT